MEKIVHGHELHVYVTSKDCKNSFHQIMGKCNNSIYKFVESIHSGNSCLRIHYRWKVHLS